MLRILYGTAGTGKSAAIMDEIRRGADSGERYILLVPEQYSHEAERELCAVCGDGLSLYAEVLSFTGLAREISSECGGAANEYLDKGGRLLCMALAADGLYSRLRVYGAARRKAELQTMLLGAVDEFKSACVTSERLMQASEACEGALGDKLHDLGLILEAYDGVVANGRADPSDRLSVLAQQIGQCSMSERTHVFVDGFTDFTAQERRVLEALLSKGVCLTVCLGCDELHGGSEVFALSRITASALLKFAADNGIKAQTERFGGESTKAKPLGEFAENMFSYRAVEAGDAQGRIKIISAADTNAECEFAAAEAVSLVRDTAAAGAISPCAPRALTIIACRWSRHFRALVRRYTPRARPTCYQSRCRCLSSRRMRSSSAAGRPTMCSTICARASADWIQTSATSLKTTFSCGSCTARRGQEPKIGGCTRRATASSRTRRPSRRLSR